MRFLNTLLGFLYPEICQFCRKNRAGPAEGYICQACRETVRWIEPPWCERCGRPVEGAITQAFVCGECQRDDPAFVWARGAAAARGVVLEMIHRFKYTRALWVEPFLAGLLTQAAAKHLDPGDWDCLVPVPLHAAKQREREFNQAERLARRLGRATGIAVETKFLKRTVFTRTQTQLTREERRANVRSAFRAAEGNRLRGKRIVVIDDVFTTGSTTDACARALRRAGAAQVCVWTVARGV